MKKDPRTMTDEEKIEGLKASGHIQSDEPIVEEKKEETPPTPPTPPVDPEVTPPTPPEPKTPVEEKDKPPVKKDGEDLPPPNPVIETEPHARPKKYIPLSQYQDEKSQWKKDQEELKIAQDRIKELSELSKKPEGAPKTEEAISKFAEKYGFEPADVKELLSTIPTGNQVPEGLVETLQTYQMEKAEKQEQEYFEKEWSPIEAQLKAKYPTATADQLKQAKDAINQAAHTEQFVDKDLDYILFKQNEEVSKILGEPSTVQPQDVKTPRRTVESSRPAGSKATLSASDFKGRKEFGEFSEMEPAVVSAIIKDMDSATYKSYITWATTQNNQGGLTVTRNGQKIVLK